MGQLDNQTEAQGGKNPQAAQDALNDLTEQLQNLKESLISQLYQEVNELQSQKNSLSTDIKNLQSQYRDLQSQQQVQQLAEVLASHLQEQLRQQIISSGTGSGQLPSSYNDNAYRLLSSLDSTLSTTLKTLQQDISSYQSALSQQLGRMHSLEQQGEAILEALVSRIKFQLQQNTQPKAIGPMEQPSARPAVQPATAPTAAPTQPSNFVTGVTLILISSLMFSLQNVIVRVILRKQTIFGLSELGGFISASPGNSLLILAMRMLFVAPIMAFIVAPWRYSNTWRDIKQLGNREQRGRLLSVIGSGFFLFLSQFFIYIALGNIPAGVATTIFFIYPTVTILLAWLIFKDKPTFLLILATVSIYIGGFLTIPNLTAGAKGNYTLGAITAIVSGIAFAIYVILIKVSKMHPIPFSVVNFTTILFLSAFVLPFGSFVPTLAYKVDPKMWPTLWIAALVLTVTSLVGYLLNNIGVPMIGPALASVVGASGPALTVVLALLIINEKLTLLQVLGVVLVTVWVLGISVENTKPKPPAQPARR
ncbi:DMT family transporter [Aerosakkonema funiforme]|uniref:EamA family transporter n=1 Tax=Aerosakkonema funiforme FACHB-1375 TaxID=2949571 RepID=A0A926ZK64_9CYAN|nr:DMT family transporter [Aerosakkonema funiforme]MBD2186278.1 EamA family transporter [Aerosakkonema funiforme FACHB-1375]